MGRFLLNLTLTLVSLGCLVVVGYGVYVQWLRTAPHDVTVPDLVGVDLVKAMDMAAQRHLIVRAVGKQVGTPYPEGTVVWMLPRAGMKVKEGRIVRVHVAGHPNPTTVPDVIGQPLADAEQTLWDSGLRPKQAGTVSSSEIPRGNVVRQVPGPGQRLDENSEVLLYLSSGEAEK